VDSYSDTRRREPGVEGGRAAVVWLLLTRTLPATSLRSGGGADAYDARRPSRLPSGVAAAWAGSGWKRDGFGWVSGPGSAASQAHSPQREVVWPSERKITRGKNVKETFNLMVKQ